MFYRWDYTSRAPDFEAFKYLKENGVKAEFLRSVFPTQTSPNHFSIATGEKLFAQQCFLSIKLIQLFIALILWLIFVIVLLFLALLSRQFTRNQSFTFLPLISADSNSKE